MNVTVFTMDECAPSKATKIYLLKHGISFVEINVSTNSTAREMLRSEGVEKIPYVEFAIDDEDVGTWCGFEPELIEDLAERIKASKTLQAPQK